MPERYVTTYCNQAHCLRTGKPVGHWCYVLPPKALELERQGKCTEAIELLQSTANARSEHKGLKA